MKTKHLLTALALPAVFAACTAEDIVTEGVGVGQAQRIALNENFKLDFGGIESRLSAGEPGEAFAYTFEEGDLVGGAIVDSYTGAKEPTTGSDCEKIDAVYSTQYFVSANQPFKFDGSAWTLEHTMVEGKYMFYYPYNEENNSRGAAKYSIPVMQDLSDKTTGKFNPKAAIEKYSMAVGYQFLDEEDLSASVELAPIFSYARIVMTLDNQYAGGEVEKVVLQSKGKAFKLNGQLDNKKIEAIFRAQAIGKYVNGTNPAPAYTWAELAGKEFDWDNHSTTDAFEMAKGVKTFYDEDFNKASSIIVGKVPAGTKMTKDAQNNHTFETYMVVPAQAMEGDVVVYLYTTDGTIYSGTAAYKGTSLVFNRNTPKKLTVGLSVNNGAVPYVIASQEDWNNSVSMMSKDEIAEFIIADSEFAIDNETKFPKNGNIIVDKVAVSGNNVTMANVWVKDELTVKEGAKLNADPSLVTKKIVNEGEVVFAEIPEVESKALTIAESKLNEFIASNYWINEIENKGTLTVEEGAELTSYDWLIEKDVTTGKGESAKTVKVVGFEVKDADSKTAGTQPTELGLKLTNKKGGIVANAGLITVWGSNEGTINNAGAINIFEGKGEWNSTANDYDAVGFTNESREYELVNSEKQIYEVVNEPKIDNAATGEIRVTVGDLTNKSLIVNAGILSCGNNEGKIANDADARGEVAVIDAKANSITLITSNTKGKVIVYAMKQENVSVKSGAGIIEYTAGADIVADASIVTDVVATASIKITQGSATDDDANGALKNLKVAADATITVVAPADNALTFSSIEVAEGKKMTLGSSMETATLKVNDKASVIVPKDLTLKVTGNKVANFSNEGSIVVTGALVAEEILKANGGTVLDNGGTGSITWKLEGVDKTLADAKDDYRKAMKTAMADFAKSNYVTETLKYNLKDSLTVNGSGKWGAASYFETWAGTQSALKAAHTAYVDAYKAKNPNAQSTAYPKITEYYTNAVDTLIAKIKDTDEYEDDLDGYTIDAPAVTKDEINFFTATKRKAVRNSTAEIAVTAKTNALNRFKQYASVDLDLDDNTKIVLCTEGSYDNVKDYVPDYTFAFEEDNVYKLYKDYLVKYEIKKYSHTTLANLKNMVKVVGNWTSEKVASLETVGEKKLHAFITDNEYAVYDEALEWNYTDKTIAAILSEAGKEVAVGAVIPNPGN